MNTKILAHRLARELRKNMTLCEKIMWNILRDRKFNNIKFLRQHPIYFQYDGRDKFFIADFYCAQYQTIVEIDGNIHDRQKEYDLYRDYLCARMGLRVLRLKNQEVVKNLPDVLRILEDFF